MKDCRLYCPNEFPWCVCALVTSVIVLSLTACGQQDQRPHSQSAVSATDKGKQRIPSNRRRVSKRLSLGSICPAKD